ncbi:MAG: PAS domain S-box protein [Bacteroidota bacterium]
MTNKPTYEELEQKVKHLENVLQSTQLPDFLKNKELFHLAFENANIGMCLVDLTGNIFKVNAEMSNIFGFSTQELEKMSVNDITHPDFINVSPQFIKNASDGNLSHSVFEKKYIHKNGHTVTCTVSSSSVVDENNNILFFISHVQDITAWKKTEQALRESEARFRSYFELPLIGIAITSPEKGWIEANEGVKNMLGYSMEELANLSWSELTHSDDLEADVEQFNRVLEDKQDTYFLEKRFIRKNGEIIWTNLSIGCVRKPDRSVDYMVALFQNISNRKKAEKALEESEQRFRAIMENVNLISANLDTNGNITFANDYFLKLTGWKREEVLGRNWFELFIPPEVELRQVLYSKLEKGMLPLSYQNEILTRNGKRRLIDWSNSVIRNAQGVIAGIAGIGVDITEQKLTTEALKKSETSLKEAIATKDKFFSIISHDLRSPFNSILGLSEHLVECIREQNNNDLEQIAVKVNNSANNTFQLLTNLLEWSRSQTNRLEFVPEHLEFRTIVEEVIKQANDIAGQKSITIISDLPKHLFVYTDKSMIKLVLRNLVSNAIKYTHAGGKIEITVEKSTDELLVSVRDNGIGISTENINKLFNVGVSFSTRGTKNEQGTGLGLILCKEFITKQGGKIWVESDLGKGSRFIFSIPLSY